MIKKRTISVVILYLFIACKTTQPHTQNTPIVGPSSCVVAGKIIERLSYRSVDTLSPCYRFPCKARVLLLKIEGCGQGVTRNVAVGDTIEMNFTYSLAPTREAVPSLKEHFPGLQINEVFSAVIYQQLVPNEEPKFMVNDYQKVNIKL
jgi:hypothetical protein